MQLKSGFSVEIDAIYAIYLYLCRPLPLSKYLQWGAVKRGKGVRRVWKDVAPPSTFQSRIRSMQNIVGKFSQIPFCRSIKIHPQATVVNTCESDHF